MFPKFWIFWFPLLLIVFFLIYAEVFQWRIHLVRYALDVKMIMKIVSYMNQDNDDLWFVNFYVTMISYSWSDKAQIWSDWSPISEIFLSPLKNTNLITNTNVQNSKSTPLLEHWMPLLCMTPDTNNSPNRPIHKLQDYFTENALDLISFFTFRISPTVVAPPVFCLLWQCLHCRCLHRLQHHWLHSLFQYLQGYLSANAPFFKVRTTQNNPWAAAPHWTGPKATQKPLGVSSPQNSAFNSNLWPGQAGLSHLLASGPSSFWPGPGK